MDAKVAVFRDEAGIQRGAGDRAPAQGGGRDRLHRRPRQRLQPGHPRRDRARLHDRQRRVHLHRRARAQGEPRRPVPDRLPGAQRRGVAQAHRPAAGRRRPGDLILRGDHHPVGTRKRGLTDGRVHAESPPLPARERRGPLLGGVQGRPRPLARGPRRDPPGQGPRRRLALGALLLQGGDLRLLRDEDQRPVRPRLQDPDRRGAGAGRTRKRASARATTAATPRSSSSRWATCP